MFPEHYESKYNDTETKEVINFVISISSYFDLTMTSSRVYLICMNQIHENSANQALTNLLEQKLRIFDMEIKNIEQKLKIEENRSIKQIIATIPLNLKLFLQSLKSLSVVN